MIEIEALSRIVCGHQWRDAEEWAAAIHRLADLEDGDLNALLKLCRDGAHPPRSS